MRSRRRPAFALRIGLSSPTDRIACFATHWHALSQALKVSQCWNSRRQNTPDSYFAIRTRFFGELVMRSTAAGIRQVVIVAAST